MGRLSTLSITDSLLALDSLPGGLSPTTLADDIFNDPLSWTGTDLICDDQEQDKDKRTAKREASVFLEKPTSLTPVKHDFTKVRPFTDQHKLANRPIKLSLNGDNMHHWESLEGGDGLARTTSTRTPKDLSKRMTRLWKHGNLFRPFPSPKRSPLDAPVSASGPFTPPVITTRFSFSHSPDLSGGGTASATWNILQFYSPHLQDGSRTAGLPPKPHSARPKVPPLPAHFIIPPPPPSAPLKRKGSTTAPKPPTPMKASHPPNPLKASAVAMPPTPMKKTSHMASPMKVSSAVPPVPKTPTKLKKKTVPAALIPPTPSRPVGSPATSSMSIAGSGSAIRSAARRPLPCIPPSTPVASGSGLTRSNTTIPRAAPPPTPVPLPVRAKSEVHPTWWQNKQVEHPPMPPLNLKM